MQEVIMRYQLAQLVLLQIVYMIKTNNEKPKANLGTVMYTHFRITTGETHTPYSTPITYTKRVYCK